MRDLLLKQKKFKISTALNPNRDIVFEEDFEDMEFDSFVISGDNLLLKSGNKTVIKLSFFKDHLEGNDTRGGKSVLTPTAPNKDDFIRHFKPAHRSEVLVPEKQTNELEGKVAIISPFSFEGHTCIDPKRERLYDIYDDLFSKGYKYIFHVHCRTTKHFIFLLENLSKTYLNGGKVGSVQVCSSKTSNDGAAVSFEDGDWKGFAIDNRTWVKIKSKMSNKRLNFFRNLTILFKEKNLMRISTDMSRDVLMTPQDKVRKNFVGI